MPHLITCHSKTVGSIAAQHGWLVGARYTNLRDIKTFSEIGLIDIDWKNYDFEKHMWAVKKTKPLVTIARDLEDIEQSEEVFSQAAQLAKHAHNVCIVPKDLKLTGQVNSFVPEQFMLGYSTPTKYGGTQLPLTDFVNRPIHILGGRPDVQRELASSLQIFSLDVNRFSLDARFGDYFNGSRFVPHPIGGYLRCLEDSIKNISSMWEVSDGRY
ncbi:DUF6610 family protein [Ruegeria sp. ANG10]|uniref:DUF6610 family protein n=1 Tax=Ruegeria sp. ANG10 TaxID=3042467 RepID=UPI00345556D0